MAAIEARHKKGTTAYHQEFCLHCREPWPCDVVDLQRQLQLAGLQRTEHIKQIHILERQLQQAQAKISATNMAVIQLEGEAERLDEALGKTVGLIMECPACRESDIFPLFPGALDIPPENTRACAPAEAQEETL